MLTRIYIDNFRCFVNFEYRPSNKQLLLGANGSGKSSLLEAVRYLKLFVGGADNPFTQLTRTRWQDKPLQVIEVDALLDGQEYRYRVEIRVDTETKQTSVSAESLTVSAATSFERTNGEIRFFSDSGSQETTTPLDDTRSGIYHSRLSNRHVRRFMEWLDSVYSFEIDAYFDKMDEPVEGGASQPDFELENFPSWYLYLLQTQPAENVRFLAALRESMDEFQELRFYPSGIGVERLRAVFRVSSNELVSYSLSELSDGQRYLICLYAILHFLIKKGYTVFIDEPDNFISLREVQPWLLSSEEAVEDHHGQLVLISHHPEILNQWAPRHGLRFFRENNGHARTEKFRSEPEGSLQPSDLIARGWEDDA